MKKEMLEKIKNSKKPLLVTGDMLSGKTNNVLFPIVDELIKENQNLFLVDTKGEYLEQFYEKVKSQGYRVKIIDLAKWTYGGVHHFNPLTGVSQDISDQLFHTVEKHDYELGIQVKTIFNYICNYIDKNLLISLGMCLWKMLESGLKKGFLHISIYRFISPHKLVL